MNSPLIRLLPQIYLINTLYDPRVRYSIQNILIKMITQFVTVIVIQIRVKCEHKSHIYINLNWIARICSCERCDDNIAIAHIIHFNLV